MAKVVVVLPVFNMEEFLAASLKSLEAQTYRDWFLVVVDDGSKDKTREILSEFMRRWSERVKIIRHGKNIGVAGSLNDAMAWIEKNVELEGKYLMRLDADDTMEARKMEKQMAFLEKHRQVDFVGCQFSEIDRKNNFLGQSKLPRSNLMIQLVLQHHCPLSHPTLMWRGEWQKKNNFRYPTHYKFAEDYAAWREIASYTRFANLGEVLYFKRYHTKQISLNFRAEQMQETREIASWRKQHLLELFYKRN